MRWRLPGAGGLVAAALLVAGSTAADLPAPAPEGADLELLEPSSGTRIRRLVPLALLQGRIGRLLLFDSDVVIAIDQSNSTLLASGLDIDGDGKVGKTRSWAKNGGGYGESKRRWTSDHGDTVLAAELALANVLVSGLSARGNRIGVLTYTDAVRVRSAVGNPELAHGALGRIRSIVDWTGTNHSRALDISADLLDSAARSSDGSRRRAVVLFSDGRPTVPNGEHWASTRALRTAEELATRGITVFTVALGEDQDADYMAELATASGGSPVSLADLRELAGGPGHPHMEPLELEIENLTAQDLARAVRTFPDGSFDAIVPLSEGENVLEVRALFVDGRRASARSVVHYERPDPATEADRRDAARWLMLLRERTREIGG